MPLITSFVLTLQARVEGLDGALKLRKVLGGVSVEDQVLEVI
jgi:hypothetical protein